MYKFSSSFFCVWIKCTLIWIRFNRVSFVCCCNIFIMCSYTHTHTVHQQNWTTTIRKKGKLNDRYSNKPHPKWQWLRWWDKTRLRHLHRMHSSESLNISIAGIQANFVIWKCVYRWPYMCHMPWMDEITHSYTIYASYYRTYRTQ